GRARGPKLLIEALAGKQRLPFSPPLAVSEPVCQAAKKSEQRAMGGGGDPHIVKPLLTADFKLPWLYPLLRGRRLQASSVRSTAFRRKCSSRRASVRSAAFKRGRLAASVWSAAFRRERLAARVRSSAFRRKRLAYEAPSA